jgi:hypothetical protein
MTDAGQTTSPLEERYRRLLKVLPAGYRATWQEEMVTTFLESMHTDDAEEADYLANYGRPSWPEVASVVSLAVSLRLGIVRHRLGGTGAPPRNALWGNAFRLVALIGLLSHATFAITSLAITLWLAGKLPWLPLPTLEYPVIVPADVWQTVSIVVGLVWLPAYLALLLGQRRVSQVLAAMATAAIFFADSRLFHLDAPFALTDVAYHVFGALPLLGLLAFHRDAPPVRARPWLIAVPIAFAAQIGMLSVTMPVDPEIFPLLDWPATYCLALVTAAMAILVRRERSAPSWPLALALLAPAVLVLRTLTLIDILQIAPPAQLPALLTLGLLEACAVLALGAVMATQAGRALRRMPTTA